MIASGENRWYFAVELVQRLLRAFPLLGRVLITPSLATALSNVVLLDEVALVHHELNVPSFEMLDEPIGHALEVLLIFAKLRVVLGIGYDRYGPALLAACGWIAERWGW